MGMRTGSRLGISLGIGLVWVIQADLPWGTGGRRPQGRIRPDQPGFISYQPWQLRLDSIALPAQGNIVVRPGQPQPAAPRPPDLGAAPGSWTYVAIRRGARVIAVDRAPLRADLLRHRQVQFHRGNAFSFRPERRVDWLLCDVIAAPARTIALLLDRVQHRRARRFVVTIKFKGHADYGLLEPLKDALARRCQDFRLSRLAANKNEVCAFGLIQPDAPTPVSG